VRGEEMLFKSENKDCISALLTEYPIENINITGRIKNGNNWNLYVRDLEKANQFIFKDIVHIKEWYSVFSTFEDNLDNLQCEFDFPNSIDFCGLPMNIAGKVKESLKGYGLEWEERCCLYYLPEEKYEQFTCSESALGNIKITDIDIVDEYYTYKGEGSREYLKINIENNPSSVLRNESGSPLSWAMMKEDGSMGVMYTLKEHRKKGYAVTVSKDLIKKIIDFGFQPYVHIVVENTASRKLAESLGLVYWGDVLWFGMRKTD
jgi:hypothetical protein